jgi:drug/metabolite transporter (DMT)-like permease
VQAPPGPASPTTATVLGILALVLWSTTVAFSRSLAVALGVMTAPAVIYCVSGTAGVGWLLATGRWRQTARLPRAYLFGCGALFVFYTVTLYLALGLAVTDQQAVEVGIINYLWPGLTLVFAVPILGRKARWTLWPGIAVAFAGVVLASTGATDLSWHGFLENLQTRAVPYLLALAAGVSWALYSNLTRKWAGGAPSHAVPWFLLASGLVFLLLRPFFQEETRWTARAAWELAYMAFVPTLLAYSFWDVAMRQGRIVLVAALSYATPLVSTWIACLYLGVPARWSLWAGCGLVVAGALVCKLSISDEEGAARAGGSWPTA